LRRHCNLFIASHNKSSFDVVLVSNPSIASLNEESLKVLLNLTKPKGKIVFATQKDNELESRLVLSGFVNVKHEELKNCE
jgi:16S rRNA G1207 methylase RsmC